jgi:3-methyladenine DNA glycosylase AlkD
MTKIQTILKDLRANAHPENLVGMARFGINTNNALGISMPWLRNYARPYRKDHALAQALWDAGVHESRIMASLVDDPAQVTEKQMDRWVHDFDSWDVCDQVCANLFRKTPFAWDKAMEWSHAGSEFVKRAGFTMMAVIGVHDKKAPDSRFIPILRRVEEECTDERNYVKKSVNWALRQAGKRNATLRPLAIQTAEKLIAMSSKSAKWIGRDAARELSRYQSAVKAQ